MPVPVPVPDEMFREGMPGTQRFVGRIVGCQAPVPRSPDRLGPPVRPRLPSVPESIPIPFPIPFPNCDGSNPHGLTTIADETSALQSSLRPLQRPRPRGRCDQPATVHRHRKPEHLRCKFAVPTGAPSLPRISGRIDSTELAPPRCDRSPKCPSQTHDPPTIRMLTKARFRRWIGTS